MKKQLLFTVLYISTLSLSAQDTVREGDSVYMFNPHDTLIARGGFNSPTTTPATAYQTLAGGNHFANAISQAYHTDTAIWLYGIAVTFDTISAGHSYMWNAIDSLIQSNCFMATLHQQNPETGQLMLVDTIGWKYPVTKRNFEYVGVCMTNYHSYLNYGDTSRGLYRAVEFYFDSPRQVYDTFYVGTQELFHTDSKNDECYYYSSSLYHAIMFERASATKWVQFPNNDIHAQPNTVLDEIWQTHFLYFETSSFFNISSVGIWGYVFPILYPRMDGCTAPARPWLVDRSSESATFEWEQADNELQLVVSPDYNGMPDTMSGVVTIAAGSTCHTATGLEADTYYGVWVRRRCHWITPTFDTAVWSPWSHVVLFNTSSAGVRGVDDVAFSLFPNPATDAFTVETPALDSRLTLFDIRGTELYSVDIRSTRTTIGIADLPSGVYFVSLTSPSGTTSKRLAVDRH